jgi:hypothetical protein
MSVAIKIQTIQSIGLVPQNQWHCSSHMIDILPYGSTHLVPQFPISFDGVFYAGSVNLVHKSPQCQQALRTARATAIKILKTNLDGPSPRVAISFRAGRPVSGRQLKSSLLNWYRIFRVSVSVTVQSEVTRSRLRVVRRRTHVDGQGNVPSSGRVVSGRKGPFPHL